MRDLLRAAGVGVATFVLLNVVGEAIRPPFDTLGEWVSHPSSPGLRRAIGLLVAAALFWGGLSDRRARWASGARWLVAALFASVSLAALADAAGFLRVLVRGEVITPSVVPASSFIAALFAALAWESASGRGRVEEGESALRRGRVGEGESASGRGRVGDGESLLDRGRVEGVELVSGRGRVEEGESGEGEIEGGTRSSSGRALPEPGQCFPCVEPVPDRESPGSARAVRPRGWLSRAAGPTVRVAVIAIVLLSLPLVRMATFGPTRYERPADCAVVFGARVYSTGQPSMALADRVDEAVRLYQRGVVSRIVMSGAVDTDAGFSEPRVMASRAEAAGVPREAIVIDEEGVDTASTVKNAARIMREEGMSTTLIVTHYYHEPRAKMLFDRAGVRAYTVPARMSRRLLKEPYFVLREVAAYYHSLLLQ